MSGRHQYRRAVSLRPESYLQLESIAAHEGRPLTQIIEGLLAEAHLAAELPEISEADVESFRDDVRDRKVRRRMPRQNAKRARERRKAAFGRQAQLCRESMCCTCHAPPPCHPHHEPPRSTKGDGKDEDTIPLCPSCHHERHFVGVSTFWGERHPEVDPNEVKARMQEAARG